jgi:hypothetical protein
MLLRISNLLGSVLAVVILFGLAIGGSALIVGCATPKEYQVEGKVVTGRVTDVQIGGGGSSNCCYWLALTLQDDKSVEIVTTVACMHAIQIKKGHKYEIKIGSTGWLASLTELSEPPVSAEAPNGP